MWSRLAPVATLLLLAPLIAEFFSGSTSITMLPALVFEIGLYGAAAVLIRELAVRRGLGPARMAAMGVAYGIVQEALLFQITFAPHFLGVDPWTSYGRALGVNWGWVVYMLGFHAAWSISIPIQLVELAFPRHRGRPWLGWSGLAVIGAIFLVFCAVVALAIRPRFGSYSAPPEVLAAAAGLALAIAAAALLVPRRTSTDPPAGWAAPAPWLVFIAAGIAGTLWFRIYGFVNGPAVMPIAAWLALAVATSAGLLAATRRGWTDLHTLAFSAGALLACLATGFTLEAARGPAALAGHAALTAVTITAVAWLLWRRTGRGPGGMERSADRTPDVEHVDHV